MPKKLSRRERSRVRKSQPVSLANLSMTVATGPSPGMDVVDALKNDIHLIKPALLYADRVTLYSPVAQMVTKISQMETFTPAEKLNFVQVTLPLVEPERAPQLLATIRELRPSSDNRNQLAQHDHIKYGMFIQRLNQFWDDQFAPVVEQIVDQTGLAELLEPVKKGLVELKPIGPLRYQMFFDRSAVSDEFMGAYAETLFGLIGRSGTYPLLDDEIGNIAWHAINEGVVTVTASATARAKQAGAASNFMHKLPAFHRATVDEILDIREDLRRPLVQFRSAMVKYTNPIEASPYGGEFQEQADEIFLREIAPALEDIRVQIENNGTLAALLGINKVTAWGSVITPVLTFGVAEVFQVYEALVATIPSTAVPVAQAVINKRKTDRQIQAHELYFLYKTNEKLS